MRQQDRGPNHDAPPCRLFGLQDLDRALVRADRLEVVEGPALRERIGLGREISQHGVDRGVDLLVGDLGGLTRLGLGGVDDRAAYDVLTGPRFR